MAKELAEKLTVSVPIELVPTAHAGHATDLAYQFAKNKKRPLIISSSGDGGYNEVINGALRAKAEGADPVCAPLPAGNANDHNRALSQRPLHEAINDSAVTYIDVIRVSIDPKRSDGARFAHSYVGLGLTPTVAVELQ